MREWSVVRFFAALGEELMKVFRALCFALALVVCCAPVARGEGFALNEWSARGVSLAGGMIGRTGTPRGVGERQPEQQPQDR